MRRKTPVAFPLLFSLLLVAGCADDSSRDTEMAESAGQAAEKVERKAESAWDSLAGSLADTRDEAIREAEQRIESAEMRLENMQADAKGTGDEAWTGLQDGIDQARAELEQMRSAAGEDWRTAKAELEKSFVRLDGQLHDAWEEASAS
jgi:hypothetical protein